MVQGWVVWGLDRVFEGRLGEAINKKTRLRFFYGGVTRTVLARQERREPQLMGWRVLLMQTSMAVR